MATDIDGCGTAGDSRRGKTRFGIEGLEALLDPIRGSITVSPASSTQRGEITCADGVQWLIAGGEQ